MAERLYTRPCAACGCGLDITLDTMTEDIVIRAQNLDPLVKDKIAVIATYKRLKKLGPSWESKHMARGLIYAGELLNAVGVQGGAVERATGLLQWLSDNKRDFDLGSAATFFKQYEAHLAAKNNVRKCVECIRPALEGAIVCKEHSWCYRCDDAGRDSGKDPKAMVIEKSTHHPICPECSR